MIPRDTNYVFYGIMCIGFGVFWFFKGFKLLKLEREIAGLPTSKIRSMAMGLVELFGQVVATTKLLDPIYNQSCAFFRIKIEELRSSGRSSRWVTVYDKSSSEVPFFLEDNTGRVMVLPGGADLQRPPTIKCSKGNIFGDVPDPTLDQFLGQFKSFGRALRLEAHILREQDPLFLFGFANPQNQPRKSFSVSDREVAEKLKSNKILMSALDTNRDGTVDGEEWQKGIQDLKTEMEQKKMEDAIKNPSKEPDVPAINIISKSPDGLLVFSSSENYVVHHFKMMATLMTWGGPALTVLGVILVYTHFR